MAFVEVRIGDAIIRVTAYNPRDGLTRLYCEMVLARLGEALEGMDGMTFDQARAWLEEHVPDAAELFAKMDAGLVLVRDTPPGEFPVDARNAAAEARIVGHLIAERSKSGASH